MTQRFTKWQKYSGNGLDAWGTAKYFKNSLTMLEMALEIDNRLKYVGNDECMWEMA